MKKILLICICILLGSCATGKINVIKEKIDYVNIKNGNELARKQDYLIENFKSFSISQKLMESDSLEWNLWFMGAKVTAPSNLIIRQLCLIDILRGTTKNYDEILEFLYILSYQPDSITLWAEGYSYWLYTYDILGKYIKMFPKDRDFSSIKNLVVKIRMGFGRTSYINKGTSYPAPYGDLRNIPLQEEELRYAKLSKDVVHTTYLTKHTVLGDVTYTYNFPLMGFNTHVPVGENMVHIEEGTPIDFKWYTGYKDKYKVKREEYLDTFSEERSKSVEKGFGGKIWKINYEKYLKREREEIETD